MSAAKERKYAGGSHFYATGECECVDNPMQLLCAQIVIHAVADWRLLVKSKAWLDPTPKKYCNFNELRQFFESGWCALLMHNFSVQPERILELLEAELRAAMQEHAEGKRKRGRKM